MTTLAAIALKLPRYNRTKVDGSWHETAHMLRVVEKLLGQSTEALRLTDAALVFDPANRPTLELRLRILQNLREQSRNSNEVGWLDYSINETRGKMK